jgi:hypothetical protein
MTTLPERLKSEYFKRVIESILVQNPTRIILNIPYICNRSQIVYVIPDWIKTHKKIIINRTIDLGPATKILGSLQLFQDVNVPIVQLDDDIIYQNFVLSGLLQSLKNYPNDVNCYYTENGTPFGFSGCASYSNTFSKLQELTSYLTPDCTFVDDDWFGWAYKKLHINVRSVDKTKPWNYSAKSIDDHEPWFELQHNTNRKQLQKQCAESLQKLL